jgi:hypothetical protein
MSSVSQDSVPASSLLLTYCGGDTAVDWHRQCDCFSISVDGAVTLSGFVYAFYTTPVFKFERMILRYLANAASTDAEAHSLAEAVSERFAVWQLGERSDSQLLMCDRYGRTRSWFAVVAQGTSERPRTLLRFGSAVGVVRGRRSGASGASGASGGFRLLTKLHTGYSRILLRAAKAKLVRNA